jgi:hypothetical protein
MKDKKNTPWTTWLFRLVIPILLFVSIWLYVERFQDENKHLDLIELENSIKTALESGDKQKAMQLIEKLHHPSTNKSHGLVQDSLITWNQYWEIRNQEILNSIQIQQLKTDSTN